MTRKTGDALDLSLYVVTDAALSRGRSHEEVARAAFAGGAQVVQLRDKSATARELLALAVRMQAIARAAGGLLIVNDRLDIALAAETDGVHLGQDDLPTETARRLLGKGKLLGVSVENGEQARQAEADGADYVAIGPIYEARGTKGDAGAPVGTGAIAEVRRATRLPLVAIGGIKAEQVAEVIGAGADSVAVVSAVVAAPDIAAAARDLSGRIARAKGA